MRWIIGIGFLLAFSSFAWAWDTRTNCYPDGLGGFTCQEIKSPLHNIGPIGWNNERDNDSTQFIPLLPDRSNRRMTCYPDGLGGITCEE